MERNIHVKLDFFILIEGLTTSHIEKGMEIQINNCKSIITVNRLPFYEAKIIDDAELLVGRITKILTPEEASYIKEQYII